MYVNIKYDYSKYKLISRQVSGPGGAAMVAPETSGVLGRDRRHLPRAAREQHGRQHGLEPHGRGGDTANSTIIWIFILA